MLEHAKGLALAVRLGVRLVVSFALSCFLLGNHPS